MVTGTKENGKMTSWMVTANTLISSVMFIKVFSLKERNVQIVQLYITVNFFCKTNRKRMSVHRRLGKRQRQRPRYYRLPKWRQVRFFYSKKTRYTGGLQNSKKQSLRSTYLHHNGAVYEGAFEGDERNGKGHMVTTNFFSFP